MPNPYADLFRTYRKGDKLSNHDLARMIKATENALPWLEANEAVVGHLVVGEALRTLRELKNFQASRRSGPFAESKG